MKINFLNNDEDNLSVFEKRKIVQLAWVNFAALCTAFVYFIYKLIFSFEQVCLPCDLSMIFLLMLALYCLYNKRINCALNIVFLIPFFVYGYYLSDFYNHIPKNETVYHTLWWVAGGLVYLAVFSVNITRLYLFFAVAVVTLWFHIKEAGLIQEYFYESQLRFQNPILIILLLFISIAGIRYYFEKGLMQVSKTLKKTTDKIQELINTSKQPIVQIKIISDEEGQITDLIIKKVNVSFEQHFKILNNKVVNQKASYIFNYLFRNSINSNDLLIINPKPQRDVFIEHLEKWYTINTIRPNDDEYICIFYDVTQQYKVISGLKDSRQRFKVLLEAIPDIFFIIDKDGVYEDFVIKDGDKLKINDSEIVGHSIYEVGFSELMANKIYQCIQDTIMNDSIESIEYALDTPNGTFMFEMRLAKLNSHSVISIARDITKRKTAEFQLEEAKNRAEAANSLKSAFLANLSHEIRTPMNAIMGSAEILAEADLPEEDRGEYSSAILNSGLQLMKMIDDTINLSKIETKTVEVEKSFIRINPLIRELFSMYEPIVKMKTEVEFEALTDIKSPAFGFVTDRVLLHESLSKLIDNAIKFTESGIVTFGYNMVSASAIEFFVEDTGKGIAADEMDKIYGRFYKIDKSNTLKNSGTGLGLAIAKEFVSLLGGKLKGESTLGEGSRFYFTLQFDKGEGFMKVVH